MKTVNYWLIFSALGVLEIMNAEQGGKLCIDPDDETRLRALFQTIINPFVAKWSTQYQDKLRLSLAYFLRHPDVLNYKVLANLQDLDMPDPSDIVAFFTVLWESLFPGEDYRAINLVGVEENNDEMEINNTQS